MYLARRKLFLALRNAITEPINPIIQIMKPEASGNATRWQGYVAREGFGITLIRNHMRANRPAIEGTKNSHRFKLLGKNVIFLKNFITPAPKQNHMMLKQSDIFRTENFLDVPYIYEIYRFPAGFF
jgi:hypothetical protein